jgi:hypothetical protein
MLMNKNTIVDNQASSGGGLHSVGANPTLVNSIFWGNVPEQISPVSNVQATYCDINFDPVWPGMGNINVYPDFVDTALGDYRLLWGSPCIDTGDPDPIYLDPDSTIADMGAFYYEQVSPLRILLSPHQTLYLIPASGDTMDYTIRITNRDAVSHRAIIWCDVTLPDGSIYGPILGPVTITIGAGITLERVRTQYVPAAAPMGVYYYNAYAVLGADTSKDSFIWGKLGSVGQDNDVGFWTNTGEDLIDLEPSSLFYPLSIILYPCYPNPFNSITNISFYLSESGQIKCVIYDLMGRMIDILMDGELKPGRYNITLEGSKLPSGIYFCRLQCGDKFLTQKIVMMK